MPPPPPPEVLLSAEAAELIAQTARHVAANGQDFAAVLMSQGPEFEFLREGPSPSLPHNGKALHVVTVTAGLC